VSAAELDAYRVLMLGSDTGAGYLRIMRALTNRDGGPRDYRAVVNATRNPYPVQVVWGALDPVLPLRRYGIKALAATGLPYLRALPARHFLQEDQAPAVSELIEQLAASKHAVA